MTNGLERKTTIPSAIPFKSYGERIIAETLDRYGLPYVYEPRLTLNIDGVNHCLVPDFYLPTRGGFVEYYGRVGNADYDKRTKWKQAGYAANNTPVLALYPWDLCHNWPNQLLRYVTHGDRTRASPPSYTVGPKVTHHHGGNYTRLYGSPRCKPYR